MENEPMTEYGYKRLCLELKKLKEIERPNVVKEIDTARSYGDLKENAEYHAAREKQAFIESRIAELSKILANAKIVDPSSYSHNKVSFGSSVRMLDLDSQKEVKYTIVGSYESDPNKGYISFNSPIAKSILGKEVGDEINMILPRGESDFEILSIEYEEIVF